MGFMVLGESSNNDATNKTEENGGAKKRKLAEYLKACVKVKTLPHRELVGSFKVHCLTVKKTAADIDNEHVDSPDVIIMVKNNLQ